MPTAKPGRDERIRAAGVVQSVIASGAPAEEWHARSLYGLRLVNNLAYRLAGSKKPLPDVPDSLKGE